MNGFFKMTQRLFLTEPSEELRDGFLKLVDDYLQSKESVYLNLYRPALKDFSRYIQKLEQHRQGRMLPYHEVPYSTFWLTDETGDVYGNLRIRHKALPVYGNIGYDIRPSSRGQGLGKVMLSRGLEKAKNLNFQRLKIACDENNHASISIIRANGGAFLERVYDRRTRLYVMRFIIEL